LGFSDGAWSLTELSKKGKKGKREKKRNWVTKREGEAAGDGRAGVDDNASLCSGSGCYPRMSCHWLLLPRLQELGVKSQACKPCPGFQHQMLDWKAQRNRQEEGSISAQVYLGEETCRGGLQPMLEPTAAYRLGILLKRKDLVNSRGNFSHCDLSIVHC
jgi:hypothetical protein